MACVSIAFYSAMVNGALHDYVLPSRGLRQGDPLSSYLFLLCAEGLSTLIRKAERERSIQGVAICCWGPHISLFFFFFFFFSDDSVIFCRASSHDCGVLHNILALYERASGQKINEAKTTLFFFFSQQEYSPCYSLRYHLHVWYL
jgi:hypothetical protein